MLSPQTFSGWGRARQAEGLPRARAGMTGPRACAQAFPLSRTQRPVFPRRFSACSRAVFRSWHRLHRLWRLVRSMNLAQSPRWGSTWSTTVARVRTPRLAHSRHQGSRRSWVGRRSSVQTDRLYQPCHSADAFLAAGLGLCLSQYPSRVRAEHPGCLHGRRGFMATGYHLRAKQKARTRPHPTLGSCRALALKALASVDVYRHGALAVATVDD